MVPKSTFIDFLDSLWRLLVVRPVFRYQRWRCQRARAYLLRHDSDYRDQYVGQEIVHRRNKLYAQGVSPMDSSIPDRWTVEEEMPPMAWPRRSTLPW